MIKMKEKFLAWLEFEKGRSEKTISAYDFELIRFTDYLKSQKINSLEKIEKKHIRNFLTFLSKTNGKQGREGISLNNQEARIKAYCESQDWELVKVFSDEGFSGKNMKREGLKNLLIFLEADNVNVVVVYKTDRLTRKQRHLYQLLEDTFEKKGVGFKSVTEPFDTTTAMGKGFLGMLGVFAQLEGDLISERTRDSLRRKIELGEYLGSPPLGFEALEKAVTLRYT